MNRCTNAFLLLGACLLAVLLAELAVRAVFPHWAPRTGRITRFWRFDPSRGWAHVPGAEGRFQSFGVDAFVRINTQGFRGPEISPSPSPDRKRVLLLGDSYVWGFGVDQDDILTAQLAARCHGLEVVNMAVSGYSTDQELLLFRERAAALQPDAVVLVVAANDFESNLRTREYVYYYKPVFILEDGELTLTHHPVPPARGALRLAALLARHSYLATQANRVGEGLWQRASEQPQTAPEGPAQATGPRPRFPRGDAERITAALVAELGAAAEAAGARFALVFTDQQGRRGRELTTFLARPEWPALHLDDFLPPAEHEELHLTGDFHWSAAGHARVADVLARELTEARLFPPGSCAGVSP